MKAKEAKKILPKSEFEAFEAILTHQIGRTPKTRLMQKASLARRLRDKYRDHSRREVHEAKTRMTNAMDTGINDRRVRILQDIIDTLEQKMDESRYSSSSSTSSKKTKVPKSDEHFRMEREEKKLIQEARRRHR
jgi:hypothetical protein